MKILSIGQFSACSMSNTCLHRNWALKKCGEVVEVDSTYKGSSFLYRVINAMFVRLRLPVYFPSHSLNKQIVETFRNGKFDVVWIDKGVFVSAKALKTLKALSPSTVIVGYSPDNMAERHNQSQDFLDSFPYYDYYVTTKSYTVDTLKRMGVENIIFVNNAYEASFHHPYDISPAEKKRLGGKVGFIGSWEKERCESILFLTQNGVPVRVWGGGKWLEYKGKYPLLQIEDCGLYSEDYNKALSAFDISLCFLRKINFDLQTTRTMEIPACKSLLMAERTVEHERLFKDGEEAAFFSSNQELLDKCKYYLSRPAECKRVTENGYLRCVNSGYSNDVMVRSILNQLHLL